MKYSRRHKALVFGIFINVVVFLFIFLAQPGVNDLTGGSARLALDKISLTVLICEFEEFENDLSSTVQSFVKALPGVQILIISKKTPYPPLDLPEENVKIIIEEQPAGNPQRWGHPLWHIQTRFVLIVPDAVRLQNVEKLRTFVNQKEVDIHAMSIIAFPVDGPYKCSVLNIDLRQWLLSYEEQSEYNMCDAITGDTPVALVLPTSYLNNLSEPFIRPYPEGLFIQFSLRQWKTALSNLKIFTKGRNLFVDEHRSWKVQQKSKERMLAMYKRFGVKLVKHNGISEWYGCNKHTARCFGTVIDDMPEFIYMGRWTPPCCLRNLRQTARYVFEVLVDSDVHYWLEGGSLLGAVRHGDIIPWDYDVDVGIYQHEISKCSQLRNVQESPQRRYVDDDGFVWEKAREGDFFRVQFSETNHLHVDIFPFYEKNGIMTKNTWFKTHRQDSEFPAHYLKPLTTIDFIGIKAYVPNHYRDFLELKFGEGVVENPQFPNPKKMKKKKEA